MKKRAIILMIALTLILAVPVPAEVNATTSSVDGGTFTALVKTKWNFPIIFQYAQYSSYEHSSRDHYANAMMDGVYTGRISALAGHKAEAQTAWYLSYDSHRSYYGFN